MRVRRAIPRLSRGLSRDAYHSAYTLFKPSDSEQRLPPPYYRGCWHGVSRGFLWGWSELPNPRQQFTTRSAFILHAASLRQAFAHCGIFVAAATRRCPGSVSVPMCRVMLSHPVPVVALVGHYPTNKLIGHGPIPDRRSLARRTMRSSEIIRYYRHFRKGTEVPPLSQSPGYVTHVLLTRPPLTLPSITLK